MFSVSDTIERNRICLMVSVQHFFSALHLENRVPPSRLPLFCIPVPGQSSWAQLRDEDSRLMTPAQIGLGNGAPKRPRDTGCDVMSDEVNLTLNKPL